MNATRQIEIFSAGCPICEETIQLINRVACPSCNVSILDMRDPQVASRAKSLGVRRFRPSSSMGRWRIAAPGGVRMSKPCGLRV